MGAIVSFAYRGPIQRLLVTLAQQMNERLVTPCYYCGIDIPVPSGFPSLGKAWRDGGTLTEDNLVIVCESCAILTSMMNDPILRPEHADG